MCFFSSPKTPSPPPPAPAPAATQAANAAPVLSNSYDPSNPESGVAAEKGSAMTKAQGTSQLTVPLDPMAANMGNNQTGLQINQ